MKQPVFESEVTLVALPVFVTDKSGKAVGGLTLEDFEIQDGGRPVPVVAFQAISVDGGVEATPMPELPLAVQAAASRQFLLLFDLHFSPPGGIVRARAAAANFVRTSLSPSDLVAVAAYGRTGLKMLTNFTSDHAYVARAIEFVGSRNAVEGESDPLGLTGALVSSAGEAQLQSDQELADEVTLLNKELRRYYVGRVNAFLATMEDLVRALSLRQGRKQVLLLSGGFFQRAWMETSARASPGEAFGQSREEPQHLPNRLRMADVFRKAGESDVIIHTVSLAGLESPVDVASMDGSNAVRGEGLEGLAAMAESTGGRFVLPTNDFGRAFREVEGISRQYYVLGFQPADPAPKPDKPRKLKVRVRRGGFNVSHRAAYALPAQSSGADPAGDRAAAAEAVGKGLSGGSLRLDLAAVAYRDRREGLSVPAVLHIDGPSLAPAARGERLELQVYGYALSKGRVLDSLALSTTIDLLKQGASVRRSGLHLLTAFAVAPGPVDLRFFVSAKGSASVGSITRQVEVPALVQGETTLSPPIPTLPSTDQITVLMQPRSARQFEIPFRLGGDAFLPATGSLQVGRPADFCVFAWHPRAGSAQAWEVTAELARPGEAPRPLRIEGTPRIVPDSDGFDRYVLTVVPSDVPPGRYSLSLTFRDPVTGRRPHTDTMVTVEDPPPTEPAK